MAAVWLKHSTTKKNGKTITGKIWQMCWKDPNGKLRTKTTGTRDKSVARQIANEHAKRLALDPWGLELPDKKKQVRWSEFTKQYLESRKGVNKPDTLKTNRLCYGVFQRLMGDINLYDFKLAVLMEFRVKRLEKVKPETVNRDLRAIRSLIYWGRSQKFNIGFTEFKDEQIFVREDQTSPVQIPFADRQAMMDALDNDLKLNQRSNDWWRVFLHIISELGLRRGEALGLTWGSYNVEEQSLNVKADTSKGRRERTLPVCEELAATLGSWFMKSGKPKKTDKILPWLKNTLRQFYNDWKKIVAGAGLEGIEPKHFRSSVASDLADAGVPMTETRDFMGHSSITTTAKFYVARAKNLAPAAQKRRDLIARFKETDKSSAEVQGLKEQLAETKALNERLLKALEALGTSPARGEDAA